MKHSLTALLLTLALFCCLLTGCGPTPDVPGGSEGSNGSSSGSTNSGTEPDDANGTNSARLQPSVSMTSVVQPGAQESNYTANYRFTITNPNTAYSVKVRLGLTLTSAAGEKRTDFTFSPVIAPGDTVCFMYTNWFPPHGLLTDLFHGLSDPGTGRADQRSAHPEAD